MVLTRRCRASSFPNAKRLMKGTESDSHTTVRELVNMYRMARAIITARREGYYIDFLILHESAEGHRLPRVGAWFALIYEMKVFRAANVETRRMVTLGP